MNLLGLPTLRDVRHVSMVGAAAALLACASAPSPAVSPATTPAAEHVGSDPRVSDAAALKAVRAAVAAADRSDADRTLDTHRDPEALFSFFGVRPGMRVAELGAGGGYSAELLARIVGPKGQVYGHNTPWVLERFAEAPWSARLAKPVMAPVVRVDAPFDAPLPPEVKNLDIVFNILFYHDSVWMEVDRAKMNAAVFAALKPGGVYAIVDHSAREGDGVAQVRNLHRIEESALRAEVESAGFVLADSAGFLRRGDDARDWSASPGAAGERRGQSDRFVLKFVKPAP